jgi:hypothetical protein
LKYERLIEKEAMSSLSRLQSKNTLHYGSGSGKDKPKFIIPSPPPKRDLEMIHYAMPKCTDTVVILVFFNPAGSHRIVQNLLYIKQKLEIAHIPFFIGELAYNDAPYVFHPGTPNIFQFRGGSYMFAKENLISCMLRRDIVKGYSKYVIMDCDIVFDTPDWIDGISTALDSYDVVQPFQWANMLNLKFKSIMIKSSIVLNPVGGHTGYVWAFRRDWYDRVGGLYEYALIGGGDKCLAHIAGIHLEWNGGTYRSDLPPLGDSSRTWYLPYTIWHLPHGVIEKRRYVERNDTISRAMSALSISKLRDAVDVGADGLFEWKSPFRTHLNTVVLNYFKSREDDG